MIADTEFPAFCFFVLRFSVVFFFFFFFLPLLRSHSCHSSEHVMRAEVISCSQIPKDYQSANSYRSALPAFRNTTL